MASPSLLPCPPALPPLPKPLPPYHQTAFLLIQFPQQMPARGVLPPHAKAVLTSRRAWRGYSVYRALLAVPSK
eukprot:318311-Pelagomonas_calceolata.AAC.1